MCTVGTTHYVNKFEYFKIAIQNHNKEPSNFMFTSQNSATRRIFLTDTTLLGCAKNQCFKNLMRGQLLRAFTTMMKQ